MAAILKPSDIERLHGQIALDVETEGSFSPWHGKLVGLGVWAEDAGVIGYVPCDGTEASRQEILEAVRTWLPGSTLVTHNGKYEFRWMDFEFEDLAQFGIFDSMLAEHLLNEEVDKDLGALEARYLKSFSKKRLLEQGKLHGGIKKIRNWPLELQAEYCVNDCRITLAVSKAQAPKLRKDNLIDFYKTQIKYMRRLYQYEQRGALIDLEYLDNNRNLAIQLVKEAETFLDSMLQERGIPPIKYGSPQKLSKVLYVDLGLEKPACPPELMGSPRAQAYNGTMTNKAILAQLEHPFAQNVLKYRQLRRMITMLTKYENLSRPLSDMEVPGHGEETILREVDGIPQLAPRYRVLHTTIKQTGTKTGRLSSSDPNFQQVTVAPVGKEFDPAGKGILLRPTFVARRGYRLVAIDYKQMEVVFFGVRSQDPKMLEMIATGEDMHDLVAEMMFEKRGNPYRKWAKTIGLGNMYGMGEAALADSLELTMAEAAEKMNLYHSTFPRVRAYMQEINSQLEQNGYITYWSGRRRHFPNKKKYYKGVNSDVQGGSADLMAVAAMRVSEYLDSRGMKEGIIVPVHDELLMELKDDEHLEETIEKVRELMSVPDLLGVPFNTDAEHGYRWGEEVEVGAGMKFHREEASLPIPFDDEEDDEED